MSNLGRLQVSYTLLADLLKLPEATHIQRVLAGDDYRWFEVVVEHRDLPHVADGAAIPVVDYVVEERVVKGRFV